MRPTYQDHSVTLYEGDCLELLPLLDPHSIDLVLTDPPYGGVKDEEWDRAWRDRKAYLAWLGALCHQWRRVLKPNGSLYVFANPQRAAHVEVMLEEFFQVLNHLVWEKTNGNANWRASKEEAMSFLPNTERILFAEQYGSDLVAMGEAGYQTAEQHLKTSLFGAPLAEAMAGTRTTAKQVTEAIGAYGTVNHGGAVSNWLGGYNIPSKAQYEAMRTFFNSRNGHHDYLRRDYEDLRRDYEALRRPFTLTARQPYTDVWRFPTVPPAPGKHPCEKPLALLEHIIRVSSRPNALVLDCFAGSGSTLDAARRLGRRALGIEKEARYCAMAVRRLAQGVLPLFGLAPRA